MIDGNEMKGMSVIIFQNADISLLHYSDNCLLLYGICSLNELSKCAAYNLDKVVNIQFIVLILILCFILIEVVHVL